MAGGIELKLQLSKDRFIEFQLPYFLQPEIPIISILKRLSAVQVVTVLKISDHGRGFELCEMNKLGSWLFDDFKHERYMIQHQTVDLALKLTSGRPSFVHAYLVDTEAASTVEIDKAETKVEDVSVGGKKIKEIDAPSKMAGYVIDKIKVDVKAAKDLEKVKARLDELDTYEVKGTTIRILPEEVMAKFRANPYIWGAYVDNHDAADTYAPPNNWGYLLVGVAFGFLLGAIVMGLGGVVIGMFLHG